MAMDDLFQSLRMLQQGATELQTSRAINGANQQVQQIKSSEASDADKRQQLTALSNQLVSHLGALGTPVDQIQQQVKAVAPVQYAGGQDMYRQGLLNGDQNLMGQGQQAIKSEEQPKMDLEKLKLQGMLPFKMLAMKNQQDKLEDADAQKMGDKMNYAVATSKSMLGQSANALLSGKRVESVLGDPSQWSSLSMPEYDLIAEGAIKMASGGVPGAQSLLAALPKGKAVTGANLKQYVTDHPEALGTNGWASMYNRVIQAEKGENLATIQDAISTVPGNFYKLYEKNPALFKSVAATHFTQAGIPVTPDDIIVDPRTKQVTTPQAAKYAAASGQAQALLTKAYATIQDEHADNTTKAAAAKAIQDWTGGGNVGLAQAIQIAKRKLRGRYYQ